MKFITNILKKTLLFLITVYQAIFRSLVGPGCRHSPSCSEYFKEALEVHGIWKGSGLGFKRILRCRPGGTHGYDPVPEREN